MVIEDQAPTSSRITTSGKSLKTHLREKLEDHMCWKELEAVLQEQAEEAGLTPANLRFHFLNFFPIVPPEVIVVRSRSPRFESKIASDTECNNFVSLYLSIKYLKYFVTAF